MKKVRIAIDTTKASSYLIEVLNDRKWVERYRFTKRKKAQEVLSQFFANYQQDPDFNYQDQEQEEE